MRPKSTFATSVMPYYLRLLLFGPGLLRLISRSNALGSKLVLHKATGRNEKDRQKNEENRMNPLKEERQSQCEHPAARQCGHRNNDMLSENYSKDAHNQASRPNARTGGVPDVRQIDVKRRAEQRRNENARDKEHEHRIAEDHDQPGDCRADERRHLACKVMHGNINGERPDEEQQTLEIPPSDISHRRSDED